MKAIKTVFLGATNTRGSRIKASDGDGHSVTVGYPHEKHEGAEAHSVAALALCHKMGWGGTLISGGLSDCYVFTFANSESFDINLTEEERAAAQERIHARFATIN